VVGKFSDWLAAKLIKNHENLLDEKVRAQYGILEGWISIVLNFFLGIVKIVLAVIFGSISLLADAVHTLSDMVTSVIIIFSFRYGQRPGDTKHPFGHGRMEQIATLVVAILLVVSGFELAKYGIEKVLEPSTLDVSWWALGIILITIFFKEWLGRISMYFGKKIDSLALEADSWHHRTDAVSSLLVILAIIAGKYGFPYLDGVVGMLIGAFVIYLGWDIARDSVDQLLGSPPDKDFLKRVNEIATEIPNVLAVHDLIVHQYGFQKIVSCHAEVPDTLTLSEAHTLAEQIEYQLSKKLGLHATIHIDPVMPPSEQSRELEGVIRDYIKKDERLADFHDLRLVGEANHINALFDLVSISDLDEDEQDRIKSDLKELISAKMPGIRNVQVYIEPRFAFHVD